MGFEATAASALFNAAGSYSSAKAKKGAYGTQAQIDENNAKLAEWKAQQDEASGAKDEQTSRLRTAQVFGEQRATMAASGVDLGQGSATDVLAGTKLVGETDALTIRDNAARAAWGDRVQAQNFMNDAAMSRSAASSINPFMSAAGSLLGDAGKVAASWTAGKKSGTLPPWASTLPSWLTPPGGP